ncbi:MAG: FecR domain-containing protein [Betaproteobacteria bacterium]
MISQWFLAALLFGAAVAETQAASAVVVEAVNMPAFVLRGGLRQPLGAGQILRPSDEIMTAAGSRVLLRLGDGSAVKLGENARFVVSAAGASPEEPGLFRATLRLLTGAFRFTTTALAKARYRRDISVHLPTVTAGIRGTDLWGKATPGREFIVLIEGRIVVQRGSAAEESMDQPLSMFDTSRSLAAPQLTGVTTAELGRYAAETEIAAGMGAARAGGRWKITAGRFAGQKQALELYDRLRAGGYAASIQPVSTRAGTIYRVRITGLPTRDEAVNLGRRVQDAFGIATPGVSM